MSWSTEEREREWRRNHEEFIKYDNVMSVVIPVTLVLSGIIFVGLLCLKVMGGC